MIRAAPAKSPLEAATTIPRRAAESFAASDSPAASRGRATKAAQTRTRIFMDGRGVITRGNAMNEQTAPTVRDVTEHGMLVQLSRRTSGPDLAPHRSARFRARL